METALKMPLSSNSIAVIKGHYCQANGMQNLNDSYKVHRNVGTANVTNKTRGTLRNMRGKQTPFKNIMGKCPTESIRVLGRSVLVIATENQCG